MNLNSRSAFLGVVLLFICFSAVKSIKAVPNPNAIQWGAPPTTFVTSLYVGVLGRDPESAAVVATHASFITSNPTSRWNRFFVFVNSREYRNSSWARKPKTYSLYRRDNGIRRNYTYSVSKNHMSAQWTFIYGKTSFGIASALRGWYYQFRPRP